MLQAFPHWIHSPLAAVLAEYPAPCTPQQVEVLTHAGLSGAEIYRLTLPWGWLCLRRWPAEHPELTRLQFLHAVARHVWQAGFRRVAVPLAARNGASYVRHEEHFWELAPWLAGTNDWRAQPSRARLTAAMEALAAFHLAAASFPSTRARAGVSPHLALRTRQARELSATIGQPAALPLAAWPELADFTPRLVAAFRRTAPKLLEELARAEPLHVPLQPCLRDIWHENVLFEGDQVSGFVDFGALAYESVAADVARLLGSMAGDDAGAWRLGLSVYTAVRPLASEEQALVEAFDHSFVALAGFQWLEWLVHERRAFADRSRVGARLTEILARLEHRAESP